MEDDRDLVLGLQDLLIHEGYDVFVANSCSEALSTLSHHHFNAVLLDLGLPDGDGLDILNNLHTTNPTLPVVIITASTTVDRTIATLSRGAFAYLIKPYNRDELRAILRRAIGINDLAIQAEHAQHALLESEDRFRSIVESANDAIVVADHQGYVVSWNRAASLMFGYTADEVVGKPLTLLMPFRYREAHEIGMERMRTTGQSKVIGHTVELHGLRKDGTEFPVELSLAVWQTRGGNYFSGIIRDVTSRKRADMAIRKTTERLTLAMRAGQLGTWEWDPRTGAVAWSDNVEQLFGLSPGSLPPTFEAFLDLIHPIDRIQVAKRMVEGTLAGTGYAGEFRLLLPNESVRWVSCTGQTFRLEHGEAFRMIGIIQCITKQKEAETALRESQVLLHQLMDHITDVFWMTDPAKTEILYVSPGYERVWGRSCDSLKSSPLSWVEAVHPDDRQQVMRDALTKQSSGHYDLEYRIIRPDGSIRWIWDRAFPIRDVTGQVYRIAGLAEDITERKRVSAARPKQERLHK